MTTLPYREDTPTAQSAMYGPPEEERRPPARVFDDLIGATTRLTTSVERLVRVVWGILVCNAILIALVILLMKGIR